MIYLVSLYYPPVSNPSSSRISHLARILIGKYGRENVRVVTGRPNYPDGRLSPEYRWRLFQRRKGKWGEDIDHLYEIPAPFRGLVRKTLGLVSFAVSVFFYFGFRRMREEDLIYVTSGPIFHVYVLSFLSRLKRNSRFVLEVRDLWPQTVAGMGFMREGTWVYKLLKSMSDEAHRRAVSSVGVVEGICDYIRAVTPDKDVDLVYNPVDTEILKPPSQDEIASFREEHTDLFCREGKTVFLYAGVHSCAMDLMNLGPALKSLSDTTRDFVFILIGYGEDKQPLRQYIAANGLGEDVVFLPYMSREDLVKHICAADFCFSSTRNKKIYEMVIPTKMCEYMACDKFVLAAHNCPFADRQSERGNALICEPGNPQKLSECMLELIRHADKYRKPRSARDYIVRNHSLQRFEELMLGLFERYCRRD
ncbi:glycosyltransferase family 4 protein [Verrucomicrobiota bacterium]